LGGVPRRGVGGLGGSTGVAGEGGPPGATQTEKLEVEQNQTDVSIVARR